MTERTKGDSSNAALFFSLLLAEDPNLLAAFDSFLKLEGCAPQTEGDFGKVLGVAAVAYIILDTPIIEAEAFFNQPELSDQANQLLERVSNLIKQGDTDVK